MTDYSPTVTVNLRSDVDTRIRWLYHMRGVLLHGGEIKLAHYVENRIDELFPKMTTAELKDLTEWLEAKRSADAS